MFITVLYGDNEEMLFNINCPVQLLLESMKSCCHCHPEGDVDLADENGQLKNLREQQQRYANEILEERETCVLLAVTKAQDPSDVVFTPLLNEDSIVNAKFLAKLGNWGEYKDPNRKTKPRKSNRKTTVVICSQAEVTTKQSSPARKRPIKP
ncbi:uncharacterized protein CXorf65 homolog [Gastrophryne carolinensis]